MTTTLEQWRIAVAALRANWFRAALTAMGVIIGVASLAAVTAVSAGAQAEVADSIRRLGGNVIKVDGEFITVGTVQSSTDRTITPGDIETIAKLPMVAAVAPHQDLESVVLSAGRKQATSWMVGMTTTYNAVQNIHIGSGRLISPSDVKFGRSVMVIGPVASTQLFEGADPIGGTVRIGRHDFRVVGVLQRRGALGGENLDNRVYVPLPVVTRVLLGGANVVHLDVRVGTEADIEPAIDELSTILRERHKLPAAYPDDFSAEDQAGLVREAQRNTGTFRILTFVLGGIALLVGGIGIMNMMLVSVHERTREIGIRKSVGATPGTVQMQFLIEAAVLSAVGGAAGVLSGIGATQVIGLLAGWRTINSPSALLVAFTVALVTGLFFGYYPARRAARMDPIVALRYE